MTWGEGRHAGNVAAHRTHSDLTWNHFVRVFILFGEAILSLRHVYRKDSSGFAGLRGLLVEELGERESHMVRRGNNASRRRGPIVN